MKETISIVLVIIGALVGAGFASGQEIFSFFYLYGENGIYGILIMSILIGILIYRVLKIIYKNEIYNYEDFLGLFIKNKKIKKIICMIINILLLISFFIMIAGFGAYFEQEIGVNKIISQDSQYLAIAEVDLSGIIIKSSIQIVSIELAQTNTENAFVYKYDAPTGKLIMKIKYQEKNNLICMYNDSIDIFTENENKEFIKYEEKKLAYVTIDLNNRIALIEENSSGEYTSDINMKILNPRNNKMKQYMTSNVAKAILNSENKIAINFGTELHIVNTNGILVKKYKSNSEINNVVMTDNLVAIVYSDNIAIINF